jgi:FMN-dependent NADH-azoreductase
MHILNIVTSPRKEQSASRALVDSFLREYKTQEAQQIDFAKTESPYESDGIPS